LTDSVNSAEFAESGNFVDLFDSAELTEWLADWLIDWLTDWLTSRHSSDLSCSIDQIVNRNAVIVGNFTSSHSRDEQMINHKSKTKENQTKYNRLKQSITVSIHFHFSFLFQWIEGVCDPYRHR
jgi:hypothetical protein